MVDSSAKNQKIEWQITSNSLQQWLHRLKTAASKSLGMCPQWWWTGKQPLPRVCPGVKEDGTISSLPLPNLSSCTRQEILDYFDNTWTLTEVLFSSLHKDEAFYRPPYHQLRHPLIFYYCHPAAFYINKLCVAGVLETSINEYFEHLFETGVDEMSWDDMSKNEMEWPTVKEVNDYRRQAYNIVRQVIQTHPELEPNHRSITQKSHLWAIFMGFEHERIHLETSSVLIRELPVHLLSKPLQWTTYHPSVITNQTSPHVPVAGVDYPVNQMLSVAAGSVTLGKPHDWPSYGWDNEYGTRQEQVRRFLASQYLISNGEFYQFVKAGGYREQRYWTETGWQWRTFRNIKCPTFWVPDGPAGLHKYKLRTCFEIVDMPWSLPVIVNYHEAKAYCAWRTEKDDSSVPYRVIMEAEHNRIRDESYRNEALGMVRDPVMTTSGHDMAQAQGMNLNLAYGCESPVDALPATSAGFYNVFGNVWEWCEDHFNPLPGFKVHHIYDDFSTPCFDGKHPMIMGGSFISTGDEASIWARFHFRAHFFQHAGFRLVCSNDGNSTCDAVDLNQENAVGNVYESQSMLNEYMLLHYGDTADAMPFHFGPSDAVNFPTRCAQLVIQRADQLSMTTDRALDIGCAVGGSVFAMARSFTEVVGIDLSASFIKAANTLKGDGRLEFFCKDEGELGRYLTATIDPAIERDRTTFIQADACALPANLMGFDAVLLANLICRLPSPKACLGRMGGPRGLVRPGGLLVITSPYTWMEQFTPKEVWLGGYEHEAMSVRSIDGLRTILGDEFELINEENMPLLIREHARKYQYIVAHATVWKRKDG